VAATLRVGGVLPEPPVPPVPPVVPVSAELEIEDAGWLKLTLHPPKTNAIPAKPRIDRSKFHIVILSVRNN
jgi:hypothetical protein